MTLPKSLEGPVRVGNRPTTSTLGPMGGQQGHIQEGRKMRASVPLLGSEGPQMAGLAGFHTVGPSGLPYEGPALAFHTAGPGQTLVQRVFVFSV